MSSESGKKSDHDKVSSENIFRIADELVRQVDMTKKLVLLMIIIVIVAIPVSWHLAPLVRGTPFKVVGYAAIAAAVIFLGIGVRQWTVLSKWTKKYKAYKEMQKKIDQKLDFEDNNSSTT
jgi:type VI protein secretion system component VasK